MKVYSTMEIYYDGKCPLCSREMRFLKNKDKSNSITLVDIHGPVIDFQKIGKSKSALTARIHATTEDKGIIEGVEVFREAYSRVGLGWILWITKFPVFKQIANLCYTLFAINRIRIGKIFGGCTEGSCTIK